MNDDNPLRLLPEHEPPPAIQARARAAFVHGRKPSFAATLVPIGLASVIGVYLFWAFTTVIALNN